MQHKFLTVLISLVFAVSFVAEGCFAVCVSGHFLS